MARPKLLLADDSVTIRKVVELTFADEGIDVTTASDAETAMQKFVEVQPDIVLVDTRLPGTTGYQICEMIKQDDATKHIPVLLLVGSFEPFDQDEAERVCSDGFLTKPFHSIRDLVARVGDLLGRETPVEDIAVAASSPGADVADIENLYDSSFVNTAEIEEFDTVDDLLGDTGLDDELIEASSPSNNGPEVRSNSFLETGDSETTKEFDWSPEAVVVEKEYQEPNNQTYESDPFDDISLHETVADDPTEGAWRRDNEPSIVLDPIAEPQRSSWQGDPVSTEEINESSGAGGYDGDSSSITHETAGIASSADEGVEMRHFEGNSPFSETVDRTPYDAREPSNAAGSSNEPSPELIALIAQRVIDHLSDNVVRDIAKEAVPRIAEKLIREALDQESKS